MWELIFFGIARADFCSIGAICVFDFAFGGFRNSRAARVGKAKNLCDLIKTFADGVVSGRADNFEMIMLFHVNNLSMSAGNYEGEEWEFRRVVGLEPVGVDVRFQMMDGVEGFVMENCESAGGQGADEEGAEQARSVGYGDGVDFVPVFVAVLIEKIGVFESLFDDGQNCVEMISGRDFGNNPAVGFENVDLRNDDVRK